jgi:PIN domain nuclease of toxin-antitoxin system
VILLLDTHVVLWWACDSPRLGRPAREAIATADIVWVSAASGWEIAIKQGLGTLVFSGSFSEMVAVTDLDELPVTLRHAEQLLGLPPHHTDPFDRMLVAQAQAERATLVTHDPVFASYDVPILQV